MVMCHVAQENGMRANYVCEYIVRTTKSRSSRIHYSMIFYPKNTKVAVEVPAYQGRLHTKFEKNCVKRFQDMSEQTFKIFFLAFFSLSFHTLEKNCCNSQTCTPIPLKFRSLVGHPEAINSTKFAENPYKILRVIINHLHKTRTIFRHTYRVNS